MFGALTLVALVCASISHVATADHVVYAPPPPTPTLSSTRTFVNLDALPLGLRPSPCLGGVDELHARLRSVERAQAQAADVVSAQARFLGGSDRGFLGGAFEGWGRRGDVASDGSLDGSVLATGLRSAALGHIVVRGGKLLPRRG